MKNVHPRRDSLQSQNVITTLPLIQPGTGATPYRQKIGTH